MIKIFYKITLKYTLRLCLKYIFIGSIFSKSILSEIIFKRIKTHWACNLKTFFFYIKK